MTPLRGTPTPDVGMILCEAATELLIVDGIGALEPVRVDRTAGLPPGTCSGHFHNRGELLCALLERHAADHRAALEMVSERHPGDPTTALAARVALLAGADLDRCRALWAVMLDAGTRREATMYIDALSAGWERAVAARFGLTADQVEVVWTMVEGWVLRSALRGAAVPDPEVLQRQLGWLLARGPAC